MGYLNIEWNGKRLLGIGKKSDGGADSGVTAYIVESKFLGSVALLKFNAGTREAFHSHAFNAITLWLKGRVVELTPMDDHGSYQRYWKAGQWKYTPRELTHKICVLKEGAWALTFRGPWKNTWKEIRKGEEVTLTHNRVIV